MCACVRRRGSFFPLVRMHARAQEKKEKKVRAEETFGSAEGFTDARKRHACLRGDQKFGWKKVTYKMYPLDKRTWIVPEKGGQSLLSDVLHNQTFLNNVQGSFVDFSSCAIERSWCAHSSSQAI